MKKWATSQFYLEAPSPFPMPPQGSSPCNSHGRKNLPSWVMMVRPDSFMVLSLSSLQVRSGKEEKRGETKEKKGGRENEREKRRIIEGERDKYVKENEKQTCAERQMYRETQ